MSLQSRNTTLNCIFVNTVSTSGMVQFGDNQETNLKSRALAVQRAIANYEDDEFRFASYPIFSLPKLTLEPCVSVSFISCSPQPNANIRVGFVRTLGVSASSLLRVGTSGPIQAESRIKHIRQYNNRDIS